MISYLSFAAALVVEPTISCLGFAVAIVETTIHCLGFAVALEESTIRHLGFDVSLAVMPTIRNLRFALAIAVA